jgi:hypothetical protein
VTALLLQATRKLLKAAGYVDLATPFKVAGVEFAFTNAMRGSEGRALDLVIFVDATTGDFGDRDGARVRQRVEALSRALDVTGSHYVVTLILAGAVLAEGVEALSETCRVLEVDDIALDADGEPVDDLACEQLSDRIRVLLPLTLPSAPAEGPESGPAMDQLAQALPAELNKALLDAVVAASSDGEQAVIDAVAKIISEAIQIDPAEEKP